MKAYINVLSEIYNSLSPRARLKLKLVVILSLFWAIIDVLVVSFFVQFLPILSGFTNSDVNQYMLEGLPLKVSLLGFVLLFSSLYRIFVIWFTNKTSAKISSEYLQSAVTSYLSCSYRTFISIESSLAINILGASSSLFFSVIRNILSLSYYATSVIFLVLLLVSRSPTAGSFALCFVVIPYVFIYVRSRSYHYFMAKGIEESQKRIIRFLTDLIKEAKMIRTLRVLNEYVKMFSVQDSEVRELYSKSDFRETSPRYLFEGLAGLIISIVTAASFYLNRLEIIEALLIILIASQRILPSAQQVYRILIHLKSYGYILDKISYFYNLQPSSSVNRLDSRAILNPSANNRLSLLVKNVSFSYTTGAPLLKGINLRVFQGDIIGISAPSGSGKTTFLDLICGLLQPDSGCISSSFLSKDRISYVTQTTNLLRGTLLYNITLSSRSTVNKANLDKAIKVSCLNQVIERLPDGLLTKIGDGFQTLSGGETRRVALARAIYRDPQLLILDEATTGLQTDLELEIMKNISDISSEKIIFIVSHSDRSFKYCTDILLFAKGTSPRLASGSNMDN